MESKDIKQSMKRYFQDLSDLYRHGDSPGIIGYCQVLKDLLYQSLNFLPGNFAQENVEIDILEIPSKLQIQMPCMRLWDGKNKIYGYIDVLAPGTGKKEILEYPWLALYKRLFPNLLLTNFLEFIYYRENRKVCTARPFNVSHLNLEEITDKLKTNRPDLFLKGLQQFMDYSAKKLKVPTFIELQERLALKTDYFMDYLSHFDGPWMPSAN
jgi:hypothetical protein